MIGVIYPPHNVLQSEFNLGPIPPPLYNFCIALSPGSGFGDIALSPGSGPGCIALSLGSQDTLSEDKNNG